MNTGFENLDVHEFIESFRQSLSAPDAAQDSQLTEMMHNYGQLCDEANRRLRECAALSQKGLYANAVSLAEQDPLLLDRCSVLEIPERDFLVTVASALGIKAPALLNLELAEILQETYQKGNSAEGNVKLLHRLTLARAPLPTRLAIMRRLQIQDPNRPFIDADIRAFEKAWFRRALEFAQSFPKTRQVEVLNEILTDLQESGYVETPPPQLITGLRSSLAKARALELPELAEAIRQAYSTLQTAELKQLAVRWKQLAANCGIDDPAAKYQITEALTWISRAMTEEARVVQRNQVRSHLIELLASPKSKRQDVEAAYQAALQQKATDWELEGRCAQWLKSRRRRTMLTIAAYGAALTLSAGGAGILFVQQNATLSAEQRSQAFIDKISKLVQDRDFTAALTAGKEVPPELTGHPEIVKLLKKATDESKRSAAFNVVLQDLKSASSGDDLESLEKVARAAAHSDEDQRQVDQLVAEVHRRRDAASAAGKTDFESRLVAVRTTAEKLLQSARNGVFGPEHGELAEKCLLEISQLDDTARKQGMDATELAGVKSMLETIAPWKETTTTLSQFATRMASARADDDSLKKTADFLSSTLARVHPEEKTKQRARAAEQDLAVWRKTLQLKELLKSGRIDPEVQQAWKNLPPERAVTAALAPAEMLRQRDFSDPTAVAFRSLKSRLESQDMKDVYRFRTLGAPPYCYWYTKTDLKGGSTPTACQVITDSKKGSIKQTIRGDRDDAELSPQSVLLPDLEQVWTVKESSEGWHKKLAKAYDKLAGDEKIEPLLKLQLMRLFLRLAVESSMGYREILEPLPTYQSISGKDGVIEGNWFFPGNTLVESRKKATTLCAEAPRLAELAQGAATLDANASTPSKENIHLAGLLIQNHSGQTTLASFSSSDRLVDCQLYVVSEGNWIEIGSLQTNQTPQLVPAASQFAGWPVFSIRTPRIAP